MQSAPVKEAISQYGYMLRILADLTSQERREMADELERGDVQAQVVLGVVPQEVRAPTLAIVRLLRWLALDDEPPAATTGAMEQRNAS